jgi:hypothetical protein
VQRCTTSSLVLCNSCSTLKCLALSRVSHLSACPSHVSGTNSSSTVRALQGLKCLPLSRVLVVVVQYLTVGVCLSHVSGTISSSTVWSTEHHKELGAAPSHLSGTYVSASPLTCRRRCPTSTRTRRDAFEASLSRDNTIIQNNPGYVPGCQVHQVPMTRWFDQVVPSQHGDFYLKHL